MKKSFLAIAIVLTAVFLTSCGTTQEVSSPAESAPQIQAQEETPKGSENEIPADENKDSEAENQNSDSGNQDSSDESATSQNENTDSRNESADSQENTISENEASTDEAENITGVSEIPAEQNPEPEEEFSEKVSDEDSYLSKDREDAPTSDERNKVSEYFIFDEPEVIVHDLPEEPVKEEKVVEESAEAEKVVETAPQPAENTTEQKPAEIAQTAPVAAVAESPKTEAEKPAEAAPDESKTEDETKSSEEPKEPETPQIVPSRSVTVKINQYLDVTYPGTGWVYIGESEKNAIFNYFGRKLGTGNTTFALRSKKAGTTLLHFYKNDALTGEYIDDYLEVTVDSKKGTGRVKAPSYADIVPAKPQRRIDRANDAQGTEAKASDDKKNTAQAKSTQTKDSKTTNTKAKTTSTAKSQTTNKNQTTKTSQNQKTQASSKTASNTKNTPSVSKDTKAANAPLTPQESDIKTVIQTTEAKNSESTPKEQNRTETAAKPEPKTKETAQNKVEIQPSVITPISSESEVTVDESNPILRERPSLSRGEGNADESLLEKAKKEFEEKKYSDALRDAQEYYNNASTRLDEALFLLGQISESNSQIRDIRFAVDSYDMLVKRYPASKLWKDAKNRSIYLKRFYIDIR